MTSTKITAAQICDAIQADIPIDTMIKNNGIYETELIKNSFVSIGVSFENDEDGNEVYIYNAFVNGEYINIGNTGNSNDKTPASVIEEIVDTLSKINLEVSVTNNKEEIENYD